MSQHSNSTKDIFLRALDVEPSGRAALLDVECGEDVALRRQVEALLRVHDEPHSLLDSPRINVGISGVATPANSPTVDQPIAEKSGTLIGPYKLLQQLGEGGMGVVYLAEQKEPVKRRVALKIIKPGMDTRQVIARFEAERQALAMMDHPNIAKVLDAGATDSGRPYFVMELVNGLPVTKYCDDQHLTPKERLELFVPICQAVQHAHQKGIIHRDLKPSNILVALYDGRPVPKIIDFGVAKATNQTLTEKTMFTQLGQVVGTLDYMSPEQAERNQLDVDTRSDIYSLGVVLYELLTGETPFDRERLRSIAFDEMLRIIREEEPPRPSTRLSSSHTLPSISGRRRMEPAKLCLLLRGELDWIVMKALEKDRGRRYETANAFATDVEHYLNDEAVAACPPSIGYRCRKFVRRNRARLVGLAVFATVLLVAVTGIGWAVRDRIAQQAQVAHERSERQARVREQLELLLLDVNRLMQEFQWDEALAAAKGAEAMLAGGDATPELKARVERSVSELEMVQRLERIRLFRNESENLGFDFENSNREYEAAFEEYGINLNTLPADLAGNSLRRHKEVLPALIAALDDWAACRRALKQEGGARAVSDLAQTVDNNLWSRRVRQAVAANDTPTLQELARSETAIYLEPSAVVLLATALDRDQPQLAAQVLDRASREHPADFWLHYSAGMVSQFTIDASYEFPSYSVSYNVLRWRDANESIRHLTAALAIRPRSVAVWNELGQALAMQGRHDEALACYRRAVEVDPSSDLSLQNLSDALWRQGKYEEAFACYRNVIKGDPTRPWCHYKLGDLFYEQGKPEEAIACYQKAIELAPNDGRSRHHLGLALEKQGKLDEAMACYRDAVEAPEVKPKQFACQSLALLLKRRGQPEEAIECYRKLAAAAPNRPMPQGYLGDELNAQGKLGEAISCYRKAIEIDSQYLPAYSGLAHALRLQGNLDEAIDCYRKLVDLDAHDYPTWNQLGVVLEQVGRGDEALLCYQKVVDLRRHDGAVRMQFGQALERQDKLDEAMACYRDALEDPEVKPKSQAGHRLAQLLKRHGKPEEAIECYREMAKGTPNEPGPQCDLARELKAQGQLDDALYHYRRAAEIDPEWAPAYIGLSAVCQQMGNHKGAVDAYHKAIELSNDGEAPHVNLGLTLQRIGEHESAIAEFRKGVEYFSNAHDQEPENELYATNLRTALMDLGVALRREGQYAEALAPFTRIVSLGSPSPQVWGEIAGCHSALGDSEGFDKAYESLMAQFPMPAARKVAQWGNLGKALYRAGRYEDARAALEKTIELRSESTPSLKQGPRWWYYAMSLYRVGEKEQARAYYDQLEKELTDNPSPNKASDEQLRDEAAKLLGIGEGTTKQRMESP